MYNTHPLISTQEVSVSAKNGDERTCLRDRKMPSGSRLDNGLGRWVQHCSSN